MTMHKIQSIPLTKDLQTADLYYRLNGPSGAPLPIVNEDLRSIHMPGGYELNLNTYFGSFYEAYWLRYTKITDIHLSFRLQGEVRLCLYRKAPSTGRFWPTEKGELIYQNDYAGSSEEISVAINAPQDCPLLHGRIYARLFSRKDGTVLSDLAWCTSQPPSNFVDLSIAICTYNRDEYLSDVLEKLALLQTEGVIGRVHIANHGKAGLRERLKSSISVLAQKMDVSIYDQENLGGSGGFARGMIEVVNGGSNGQVVLMDDDVIINPEIVRRLPLVLGYIKDDIAVGGHMLDSLVPRKLREAGGLFRPEWIATSPIASHVDICSEEGLNHFAKVDFVNYHAWWFFAFPARKIAEAGLPLPFFIKCDDVEYGSRLTKAHVTSVSWPGLAIWHEPFYYKTDAFIFYYALRNSMLTYEYLGLFQKRDVLRKLSSLFSATMMQFYYHRSLALVRAMEDFLKGPEVLAKWTAADHRKLVAEEKQWCEPDISRSTSLPPATLTSKKPRWSWLERPAAIGRILSDMLRPVNSKTPLKGVDYWDGWNIWCAAKQDAIAVTHDLADVYHVYRRDPKKIRHLLIRFCKAYMAIAFGAAGKRDKAHMDQLHTETFWRQRLKLPHAETSRKPHLTPVDRGSDTATENEPIFMKTGTVKR